MRVHELVDAFTVAGNPALEYGAAAAVAGGNLVLTLNSAGTGYVASRDVYDLTGSRLVVELAEIPVTDRAGVTITLHTEQMSAEAFWWSINAGQLEAVRYMGQQQTTGWSTEFDLNVHRWLSIRPEGSALVWSTSSNGIDWTDRAMLATVVPITALRVRLTGVKFDGDVEDDGLTPGPAKFASLNLPPVAPADPLTTIVADGNAPGIAVDVLPATGEAGTFVLDVSELDGTDLLGWGDDPTGWVNIVCDVTRVSITRGVTAELGPLTQAEAGTCSLQLIDYERRFDPTINADAIHPRTPVRVRAYGTRPAYELVELRRNRVPNPSTESSTAPYVGTAMALTIVAGKLRAAAQTLATASPFAGAAGPTPGAQGDHPNARFAVTPGQRVALRVEVTNPNAAARTVRPELRWSQWADPNHAATVAATTGAAVTIPAGQTVTLELIATAPAGTTNRVLPVVAFAGATAATNLAGTEVFDLTSWALLLGDDAPTVAPVPYFDGDTADTGEGVDAILYEWAGAAGASASIEFGRVEIVEPWTAVLFTGKINGDGIAVDYAQTGPPTVTLGASDLIGSLSRWESTGYAEPGVGAGDNLLERVGRVLDETGIGDAGLTLDPDTAYSATLAPTTLTNAWGSIERAAEAEIGRVWVTANNRLAVRSRGSQLSGPVRGTLSDWHGETVADEGDVHCCYTAPRVRYSPEQLTNRAIAARRGGAAPVQVDDESSQARFDVAAHTDTSLELEDDGQVLLWARALLVGQTEPQVRVDEVAPTPWAAPEAWPAVALTDIGDRWNFRLHPEVGPTIRQTMGVLGIVHEITPEGWSVTWRTAHAPPLGESGSGWFTLDVSELDGGDLLVPFG